jgi:hypothetical protein
LLFCGSEADDPTDGNPEAGDPAVDKPEVDKPEVDNSAVKVCEGFGSTAVDLKAFDFNPSFLDAFV